LLVKRGCFLAVPCRDALGLESLFAQRFDRFLERVEIPLEFAQARGGCVQASPLLLLLSLAFVELPDALPKSFLVTLQGLPARFALLPLASQLLPLLTQFGCLPIERVLGLRQLAATPLELLRSLLDLLAVLVQLGVLLLDPRIVGLHLGDAACVLIAGGFNLSPANLELGNLRAESFDLLGQPGPLVGDLVTGGADSTREVGFALADQLDAAKHRAP
jgi:hypothetical protein